MRGQALAKRSYWWDRTSVDADAAPLRAVIFDLDGAVADLEREGHRAAFNAAFAAHGFDIEWSVEDYTHLRTIADDERRVLVDLRRRGYGGELGVIAAELCSTKDALFGECVVDGDVEARCGLLDSVMSLFVAGVWISVVSTGEREWAQPLVRNVIGDGIVETIVTADDVTGSDPRTDTFELALWEMGVSAEHALAVVGSAASLHAASRVGLSAIAVPTEFTASEDFTGAVSVRSCYEGDQPLLAPELQRIHRRLGTDRKADAA